MASNRWSCCSWPQDITFTFLAPSRHDWRNIPRHNARNCPFRGSLPEHCAYSAVSLLLLLYCSLFFTQWEFYIEKHNKTLLCFCNSGALKVTIWHMRHISNGPIDPTGAALNGKIPNLYTASNKMTHSGSCRILQTLNSLSFGAAYILFISTYLTMLSVFIMKIMWSIHWATALTGIQDNTMNKGCMQTFRFCLLFLMNFLLPSVQYECMTHAWLILLFVCVCTCGFPHVWSILFILNRLMLNLSKHGYLGKQSTTQMANLCGLILHYVSQLTVVEKVERQNTCSFCRIIY